MDCERDDEKTEDAQRESWIWLATGQYVGYEESKD